MDDKRGHQRGVASARERKGRGGDVKERGRAAAWVNLGRAKIGRAHWLLAGECAGSGGISKFPRKL